MESRKENYIKLAACAGFTALFVGAGILGGIIGANKLKVAKRAAAALYEPVGNGGALYEMSGQRSLRRKQMYKQMEKAYYEALGREPVSDQPVEQKKLLDLEDCFD